MHHHIHKNFLPVSVMSNINPLNLSTINLPHPHTYSQTFEVSIPFRPLPTLLYVFVSSTSVSCRTYPILLE